MPRAYWQSADTQQRADALAFTSQANNEVATLGFSTNAASDIDGLGDHLKLADPLPVVVSDRPDAMTIRQNQQAAAPTESRASTTSAGTGAAGTGAAGAQPPAAGGGTAAAMPSGGGWAGGPTPSGGGKADRYAAQIAQVSQEEGVPYDVLAGLIDTESSGEDSVSPAGAAGIMQVVPGQGYDLPGEDARDPLTSIRQGARAVKAKYGATGSWEQAGRAYFGYGTDAGGMTTDRYGQIYDANRARYQGGASQPASQQQAAPAPSMPSEAPAAAPSPVGGEVTVRHRGTGALTTMPADQWQYVTDKSSYDIVSGPDQYKAIDAQAIDAQATDDPGGMSAGDQKRAKLAALSSSPQPMPGSQGPYDNGPAPLPGATAPQTAPSAAPETDADGLPILPGTRILPGPPQGVSSDQMPNDPVIQDQRVNQQMYRLPIGAPTQGADTATGEDYDPRDADQGAHEQTAPPSTPDDASGFAPPTTYAGGGDDAGAPTPTAPASYGTAGDDPGQAPTPAPVQPAPSDEQPGAVQQAISWAGGKLKPVLNAAGEVVAYVHDTAQGAADQIGANVAGNRQAVTDANAASGADAIDWGQGAQNAAQSIGDTVSTEGIATPIGRGIANAVTRPLLGKPPLPDSGQPETSIDRAIVETGRSLGSNIQAAQQGVESGDYLQAGMGALGVVGDLAPSTTLARQLNAMLPKADTPFGEIGAGDVVMTAALVHDAARLGYGVIKAGGRLSSTIARAISEGVPAERFSEWARGNAERVSAADARMAEQGSTVAPGTLGVVSGNPWEANAAAGTRVVPPHVSDTLDFSVRVPTDPGVVRAIEAAGGSVDPERGVNLNVIRYQGPEAHGKPSTRSSTFYTADKPGAPSPYATANNGGNGVGGSDRIEAPTTYRSPLVLDEPPGSMRGFNRAMDQLGVTAADGSQVLSADIDQGIAAARRAGPPGSSERAQALKDLVSKYGGDPAAIDDLLAVRGADDSESGWAIKENILAHNARAKGYDGVLTVQHVDPPTSDLLAHPDVVAASKAEKDAQVAVMRADRRRSDAQGRGADWQELNQLDAEKDHASSAWLDAQQARMAAIEKAKQELGGGKITELADFRESHNPTPGAFTEPFDQIRIETTPRGFYRVAEYDARGNFAGYVSGEYRTQDLAESARTRYIDQEWHGQRADPGYTLRSDLPRRGGTTEAASRPGIAASGRVLTDVSNSIGGGVFGAASGAALPADSDEDRRRNALIGAGAGMLAGPVAGRLMRHGEGGALATFGASPNYRPPTPKQVQSAAQQGAQRGRRLNQIVKAPASDVPLAVRAATGATDDRAGLRWAEDMLSDAAGNPRMRENDPARPSTQSRVNAGGVAAERIASDLEPAITQAGRAGLQDDLPRYLEDMHARDIMDAFYTREKQKVLDDRAQKIAASQSRGASPNVIARMQAKAQTDAEAAGTRAVRKRQGSNPEHTYEATDARLQEQEQRLKADGRWQGLQDAAQAVWDHNAETRDRLVMSGNLDPQVAADLAQTYPHYVPTVPVSHLTEGAGPVASSSNAVSRGTRASVSALDDVGTSGDRLNPIVASRDSTVRAERDIQRNTVAHAFAQMMDDALQASPGTMATSAATHRTFLGGGTDVHYFENGERQTLNVPKSIANGIQASADMGASSDAAGRLWRTAMGAVTSAMTAGRASFLPVNLARDAQDYAIRTAAKEGGPHKLPGVVGTWISEASKAVADVARAQLTGRSVAGAAIGSAAGAAQGDDQTTIGERARHAVEGGVAGAFLLGANKVGATGKAAEYLARGGGSGGLSAHWTSGQRWYRDVQRGGGVPIKSAGDAAHYLGDWLHDIATLQGVKGINERTELISRTAAMTRADKQGLAPVESMIRGRDASYDPDRSGTMARMFNGWVPFFNASVQNSAQFGRLLKQNPVAAGTTLVATVAPVMLAAEAWNRSDPTRAQVYDDIPQYIKDSGIVAVLPWAGSDNRGSRPNYLWVPTGVQTPFITGMRKAMEKLPGLEPTEGRGNEDWAGTLGSVLGMFSPVRGDSVGAAMSNLVPQIAKQGVELGVNRDLYRGNPIETDTADERASAASRAVAGGANAVGRAVGSDWLQEVRPSGVEHIMQALPAYGDLVSGASDMIAPSGYKQGEDRPVQNEPFVGGIAGRFLRDTGGANLQRAQDDKLPQNVRTVFEDAGMRPSDMGTVPGSYKNAPLTREEQERWQTTTNQVMAQQIAQVRRDPKWRDPSTREQAVRDAMAAARELAAQRALRNLTDREIDRRKRADQAMKAAN